MNFAVINQKKKKIYTQRSKYCKLTTKFVV